MTGTKDFFTTGKFTEMQCSECGIVYFFPEKWTGTAWRKGVSWKCPNGHGQWFGESRFETLRRERDGLKQELARAEGEAESYLELAKYNEKSAASYKGKYRHIKNRVGAGVCPCCKRNFANLARHMKSQHPEVVPMRKVKLSG